MKNTLNEAQKNLVKLRDNLDLDYRETIIIANALLTINKYQIEYINQK